VREIPEASFEYLVDAIRFNVPLTAWHKYIKNFGPKILSDINSLKQSISYKDLQFLADNYFCSKRRFSIRLFHISDPIFTSFDTIDDDVWEEISEKAFSFLKIEKVKETPQLWQVYINETFSSITFVYVARLKKFAYGINPKTFKLEKQPKLGIGYVTLRANNEIIDVRGSDINLRLAREMVEMTLFKIFRTKARVHPVTFRRSADFISNLLSPQNIETIGYLSLKFNNPNEPGRIVYSARKKDGKIIMDLRKLKEVKKKVKKALSHGGGITTIHGKLKIDDSPFEKGISFGINLMDSKITIFGSYFGSYSENAISKVINKIYLIWKGTPIEEERAKYLQKDHVLYWIQKYSGN